MDLANSHNSGVFKRSKVKKKKLKNILRLALQGGSVGVLKTEASLSQQHGESTSEKLATPTPFIVANKLEQIGKATDTIKIEPASAKSYDKSCKKEGKFPRLKTRSVINKKSTAASLVGMECSGDISIKEKKNNRKKRTKCTTNEYSQNDSLLRVKDSFSNVSNEKKVHQTVQEPKLQSNNEGKLKLNYSVNSHSSNKVLKRNSKKVVRKDSVETSNLNLDSCMIKNDDIICSAENDVHLKFLSNITIQTSSTDVDQKPHQEGKLNGKYIHGINCTKSRLKKPLPMCIEMGGEDCVPFKFFGDRPTDIKSNSVKPIVSEDHELFCRKLKDLSEIETEKWEIKVVDVQSSSFNKNVTEDKDHEPEKEQEQEEVQDVQEDVTDKVTNRAQIKHFAIFHENHFSSATLLILPPGERINLKGILTLKLLLGSIKVLGYEMTKGETHTVYSPFGFTFLKLWNNFSCNDEEKYMKQLESLFSEFPTLKRNSDLIPVFSTIILLEEAAYSFIRTFDKFVTDPIFRDRSKESGGVINTRPIIVKPKPEYFVKPIINKHTEMFGNDKLRGEEEWDVIAKQLAEFGKCNPVGLRFAALGGKGVGKSTFLRFIVNQMLSWKQKVLYIDLDPGQCEFTTPGCLSATIIEKPLLGPNFTHLSRPERCVYFGEVEVTNRVTAYMECVKYIHDWCLSEECLSHIPWCINTMGFPRGFGLEIALYTINLFQPSHVIQINSGWRINNFDCSLTSDNVKNREPKCIHFKKNWDLQYHFYAIDSAVEKEDQTESIMTWPPSTLRNFTIVAYFHSAMLYSNSLLNVVPHAIRFEDVKLCVCHETINYSDYLNAMNANLVGLCNVGSGKGLLPSEPGYPEIWTGRPLGPCYGMGIVRGVDMDEKIIFLVTPLSREELDDVNCLVLGAVNIPSSMIFAQDEAEGEIPYVMVGRQPVLQREGKKKREWHE